MSGVVTAIGIVDAVMVSAGERLSIAGFGFKVNSGVIDGATMGADGIKSGAGVAISVGVGAEVITVPIRA